jgi:hypothetical protein
VALLPLLLLSIVVVALVIGWFAVRAVDDENARRRRIFHEWRAAARAAGLDAQQFGERESRAQGVVQEVSVHANLKLDQESEQIVYRSYVWAKSDHLPRHLSLQRDSALRSVARWVEGQDVPIGDPDFDDLIELPAVDAHVCAALCYQARGQLTKLLGWGGSVRDGMVVCSSTWSVEHNRSLTLLLRSVASLTRLLSVPPGKVPQRLAHNAVNDPAPDVRLENLRYLVAPSTRAPPELITSTAAQLLGEWHAPVRLLAAQHAGKDGHAVLLALAADTQLDRSLRVQAVESLGRHPVPAVDGLRAVLVSAHPPELTVAALAVIGWSDDATLREAVLSCARSEHDSVRAEAARVLGRLAHPQAEPILIQLLSDAASDVQHASAEALGLFGSVAAVEPLLPLAETLVRPRLRQAARGAIGRIQSRLGDVEAGRLSLSDPRDLAGAVDVVDTSALRVGEVSLAEEPVAPVRQKADPGGA